jgi:large subunit ribosomal protein L17
MANQLLMKGQLQTTLAKGRVVQQTAERLITISATNDLTHRRRLIQLTNDRQVTNHLLEKLGPKFKARPGGYTRLVKIGQRLGDRAMKVKLTLVE